MAQEPWAPSFTRFVIPMYFADPEITAERLDRAGFTDIETWLEETPTVFESETVYREFLTNVIFHHFLEVIPDPALRASFIEKLVEQGRGDNPPFLIDYWRLNIQAVRR